MQPNDNDDTTRNVNVPARPTTGPVRAPDREAAAQLMRQQIDSIYDETPSEKQHINPYKQTHSEQADHAAANTGANSDWKQYHSAWQSYYQQYYERYYLAQLHRRQQAVKPSSHASTSQPQNQIVSSAQQVELTEDQAVNELRSKLISEVKDR